MCLYVDEEGTKKFLKKNQNNKEIVVWKAVYQEGVNYITPYMGKKVKLNSKLKAKNPISNYQNGHKNYNNEYEIEDGAIHVCRTRNIARTHSSKQIKCIAKIKDLIAVGTNGDLAFKEIFVTDHISK